MDCIELTLRTDSAIESVRRIATEVPEVVVGVGTILTPQQAIWPKMQGRTLVLLLVPVRVWCKEPLKSVYRFHLESARRPILKWRWNWGVEC